MLCDREEKACSVKSYFGIGYGGEEGLRVFLEELNLRGAEIGLYEANRGELEVHDGVWLQTHSSQFAHLRPIPSQGASHSDCQACS